MCALIVLVALLAAGITARKLQHANKGYLDNRSINNEPFNRTRWHGTPPYSAPAGKTIIPQNHNTTQYAVNGKRIPDVHFDVGESYAGLMPISSRKNASELYFWFFPSANALAADEIVIWLNGGPGCSSLEGLLQENGPFLWQYGTYLPVRNQYTWVNLTNVVWIEQPVGTGFSKVGVEGQPQNELDVAEQFLGFWKNFVDTFGLHGRKVYITGESYAGFYVPYIADAMHNDTNKDYYNIDSILPYDPSTTYYVVENDVPSVPFLDYWSRLFSLNSSFVIDIHEKWQTCGYQAFFEQAMTFPPNGPLPDPPNVDHSSPGCSVWNDINNAAILINPCWDAYQIATTCPLLWDVLGFPGSFPYLPDRAQVYFNRPEVQRAINAPLQKWEECTNGVLEKDDSPPSGLSVLPRVIEKNKRTILAHGQLDYLILTNGTLAMIQNMTWNGAQGFSSYPSSEFYVPYHPDPYLGSLAGAGVFGSWHTERGLTFCTVDLAGHMVPQYAPSAAYRQLEFMLGRIPDLSHRSDFTTQTGPYN